MENLSCRLKTIYSIWPKDTTSAIINALKEDELGTKSNVLKEHKALSSSLLIFSFIRQNEKTYEESCFSPRAYMRPRVLIGKLLIKIGRLAHPFGMFIRRLGEFAQPLAVLVMRPDDLVELGRESYSRADMVKHFSDKNLVDSGLNSDETVILEEIPLKRGKLLLLGVGGGRETIHLSRLGFEVTGIDFVPEMVEKAMKNAASRGLKIEGLVQEVSKLDLPEVSYDIIWLSSGCTHLFLPRRGESKCYIK